MSLQLVPPLKNLGEVMAAFRLLARRAQVHPGCLKCQVENDETNEGIVIFQEEWLSWDGLEQYIQSDNFLRILQLMETSTVEPTLRFEGPNKVCGMELVESLRQKTKTP